MSAAAFILSDSPRKCKFLGMLKLIKELKKYIYKKENNEARGKPKFNFCFIFGFYFIGINPFSVGLITSYHPIINKFGTLR